MPEPGPGEARGASPGVELKRRPRVPLIWVIPIVAALVAGFLAWRTWSEMGPTITIRFETASGLEEGKTQVRYRDVSLGVIETVALSEDGSHVVATARMDKQATRYLLEGTKFWVESARITAGGVSGLSTLLSGAYVGMLPGPGKPAREYQGQQTPPVLTMDVPGRTFQLTAEKLGSLSGGSPVFFRGIQVGQILGHALQPDGKGVTIFAFVRSPYDALVKSGSHFWNASGIDASFGAKGLRVHTEGLVSILLGGVAFETPPEAEKAAPSADGARFALFQSYEAIQEGQYTTRIPFLVRFDGSVEGLAAGAPVLMRGLQIGVVRSVRLEIDLATSTVHIPVVIDIEPQRAVLIGAIRESPDRERAAVMVEHGLRAQLKSGNLLTGSLEISLDFFPDAPKATLTWEDGLPVVPTVPSQIQQIEKEIEVFVKKLAKAPVAELVSDLRDAVRNVDRVLASKQVQEGVPELVEKVNGLVTDADGLVATAGNAIGPDSALRHELVRMIEELTRTARSLRTLADFLERDPNALIFGKEGTP